MPSIATTRLYEAIYIVDPDLGEEQVTAITDRYKQLIETNGGAVEKIDVWERRKLAYEIKGKNEGIYVVMHFTGEPKVETELRRIFQISEDQIRFMIVKPEETPPTAPAAAASTGFSRPAAAPAPAAQAPAIPTPAAVTEPSGPAGAETTDTITEVPEAAAAVPETAPAEPVAA